MLLQLLYMYTIVKPNAAIHIPIFKPTQNPAMSSASADDDMDSIEKPTQSLLAWSRIGLKHDQDCFLRVYKHVQGPEGQTGETRHQGSMISQACVECRSEYKK